MSVRRFVNLIMAGDRVVRIERFTAHVLCRAHYRVLSTTSNVNWSFIRRSPWLTRFLTVGHDDCTLWQRFSCDLLNHMHLDVSLPNTAVGRLLNYLPLNMSNLIAELSRVEGTDSFARQSLTSHCQLTRRYALYSPATLSLVSHALLYPPLYII